MTFEHSVDSFIKPSFAPRPEPAHAVTERGTSAGAGATATQKAERVLTREVSSRAEAPEIETDEEFSFYDLIDVINPLQHIPVVSSLYREITGDEIKAPARVLGGFIFGGPVGFVSSAVNAIMVESEGHDLGEAAMAFVFGDDDAAGAANLASAGDDGAIEAATQAGPTQAGPTAGAQAAATAAAPSSSAAQAATIATSGATGAAASLSGSTASDLLVGQSALDALAADLRGGPRPAAAAGSAAARSAATAAGATATGPLPSAAQPSGTSAMPASVALGLAPPPASTAPPPRSARAAQAGQPTAGRAGGQESRQGDLAAASGGVPANLKDLGSRDRRGLGPIHPNRVTPSGGPDLPGAGARASHDSRPVGAAAPGARSESSFGPLVNLDPTRVMPPPLPTPTLTGPAVPGSVLSGSARPAPGVPMSAFSGAGASSAGAIADGSAPGNVSAQMLDALQKYETLMQDRRGGGRAKPS